MHATAPRTEAQGGRRLAGPGGLREGGQRRDPILAALPAGPVSSNLQRRWSSAAGSFQTQHALDRLAETVKAFPHAYVNFSK